MRVSPLWRSLIWGLVPGLVTTLVSKDPLGGETLSVCLCLCVFVTAEFRFCTGSVFLDLGFQLLTSWEETEGVISRRARSPIAAPGEILGNEKRPRDTWEIPIWVLVRIRKFSWIGGTVCPLCCLYFWNGFVCLGGDEHLFVCVSSVGLLFYLTCDFDDWDRLSW